MTALAHGSSGELVRIGSMARPLRSISIPRTVAMLVVACASCKPADETKTPSIVRDRELAHDASAADTSTIGTTSIDAPAVIVLPALDAKCSVDADCATTFWTLSGPLSCCWQCGSTAGNVVWTKRVDAICKAASPPMCPPLACPAGPMHARCDSGTCVGVF